jgi:hypothetical protein
MVMAAEIPHLDRNANDCSKLCAFEHYSSIEPCKSSDNVSLRGMLPFFPVQQKGCNN